MPQGVNVFYFVIGLSMLLYPGKKAYDDKYFVLRAGSCVVTLPGIVFATLILMGTAPGRRFKSEGEL